MRRYQGVSPSYAAERWSATFLSTGSPTANRFFVATARGWAKVRRQITAYQITSERDGFDVDCRAYRPGPLELAVEYPNNIRHTVGGRLLAEFDCPPARVGSGVAFRGKKTLPAPTRPPTGTTQSVALLVTNSIVPVLVVRKVVECYRSTLISTDMYVHPAPAGGLT